ncbi:MAG: endopeptidase La [Ruminococcus sp.]|uniref:endopeptidase La n=1 Tax=Ruminococcus sp. TaxID=41978 RepID=UPI002872DE3F|nr:endopeptidase La [Ruminococcus sp.]MBQ3284994.1 endopeptidase La [Ruminococcus sp.]
MKDFTNRLNLPVLPLRGVVMFPKMMLNFDVNRMRSKRAVDMAVEGDQLIFLTAQMDAGVNEPEVEDIYKVGVVCRVKQVVKEDRKSTRVVVEGLWRGAIVESMPNDSCLFAAVEPYGDTKVKALTTRDIALMRSLKATFERYMELTPKLPTDILFRIGTASDPGELADYVASNVMLDTEIKQIILETVNISDRLEVLIDAMQNEIFIMSVEQDIMDKAKERIDQSQRDYYLREQMNVIRDELGENGDFNDIDELRKKITDMKLPEEVEKALMKECSRLERLPVGTNESSVIETYIDTVLELPWNTVTEEKIDLDAVREQLDRDHYGLDKVKKRVLEQLAVRKLSDKAKGQIICLVGPPGVGKTSIAMSIGDAIGRKSGRVALGGVRDEAEIRGHRRTYIASMPGRIINAVRKCGTRNPLLILDEVDKLSSDYKGDPSSALLEVLDSEQNYAFVDHYIDLPFDLSDVMFITTANDADAIPAPLRDRMDVIELPSYTRVEKFNIAKKHLLPKQMDLCGIRRKNFRITDKAIYAVIDYYTREAGVRNLERELTAILRKAAVAILSDPDTVVRVSDKNLEAFLGVKKYLDDVSAKKDEVGLVNGLAWTTVGGTLLPLECVVMPGSGKIELTGSLGDVMQESAKAAITAIRIRCDKYHIDPDFYKNYDIHIHALEGAIPKDGPSAGVTMATALYSSLTGLPVRADVAMTGEISISGKVLPIGGLKEKSMAAYKAGVKHVIIPKENERDLSEFDAELLEHITYHPVSTVDEVLALAIVTKDKPAEKSAKGRKKAAKTVRSEELGVRS